MGEARPLSGMACWGQAAAAACLSRRNSWEGPTAHLSPVAVALEEDLDFDLPLARLGHEHPPRHSHVFLVLVHGYDH